MKKIMTVALFFLAAGIFTSVTILAAYQILIIIPICFYTYRAITTKTFVLPKSAWILILFSIYALVGIFSNWEILPKPINNIGKIKYFLFGALGIFVYRHWLTAAPLKVKQFLMNTFLLSIVIASCAAMYKFSQTGERTGGFVHIMRYGYGTAMALLVLISGVLHREKLGPWFNWKFATVAIVFGTIGLLLSQTRGAMLGLICGLPFVLYYFKPRLGKILGVFAMTGLVAVGSIYFFSERKFENRYLMTKNNVSDNVRINLWKSASIAISEKPLAGWGLSNFSTQVRRISNKEYYDMKDHYETHAHNIFFEIGASTGLIGLTLFVLWLLFWAMETFKKDTLRKAIVIPFGVALVVSGQFEYILDANNGSMIFFLYAITSTEPSSC